jgi:8-oxo-dGTP pyrophosphatase MutT (NUDIX family)
VSLHHNNLLINLTFASHFLLQSFPGALDVTAGGGMCVGDSALDTIIREASEEASLDVNFVRQNLLPVGVLSFSYRSPTGWILPGLYYLYELELGPDGTPRPTVNKADGEVEGFELMSVSEILENLVENKFKPSSALAMVDFLVRHGHITELSEKSYSEVCMTLRRDLLLPIPWRA